MIGFWIFLEDGAIELLLGWMWVIRERKIMDSKIFGLTKNICAMSFPKMSSHMEASLGVMSVCA